MQLIGSDDISDGMRRWFGVSLAAVVATASLAWGGITGWTGTLLSVSILAVYYAFPGAQPSIIHLWRVITLPISFLIGHILLGCIYFLIVTPIGLVRRLLGHDELGIRSTYRNVDPSMQRSNWEARKAEERPLEDYFRQY